MGWRNEEMHHDWKQRGGRRAWSSMMITKGWSSWGSKRSNLCVFGMGETKPLWSNCLWIIWTALVHSHVRLERKKNSIFSDPDLGDCPVKQNVLCVPSPCRLGLWPDMPRALKLWRDSMRLIFSLTPPAKWKVSCMHLRKFCWTKRRKGLVRMFPGAVPQRRASWSGWTPGVLAMDRVEQCSTKHL